MAIEFTDEEVEQLYNKGFTDEDIQYTIDEDRKNGLSDSQIQANILKSLSVETQQTPVQQPQAQPKGVDLTPSGLFKGSQDVIASAIAAPITANKNNVSLKDAYNQNRDILKQNRAKNPTPIQDFAVDMAGYSLIPTPNAKAAGLARAGQFLGTAALQGGVPMALESLKRGGNVLGGLSAGTLLAAGLEGLGKGVGRLAQIPQVANVAKQISKLPETIYLNSYPGLKEETVRQLIKPNSKALDLTNEQADRLALNTAERLRDDYNALVSKRGDTVGNLLKELPEDKTFKAEQLLNNYNSILNNYSLSNNPTLNPARNATKKEIAKIEDLLGGNMPDIAKSQNQVSPKELYDINKNIDKLMINWDKPGTELKNNVLEQIYLSNAKKLSDLSPELAQANKAYAEAKNYVGKKSRLRNILSPNRSLEDAASSLKNYKSTDDNIFELQNLLEKEGNAPYLNDIDDVNAAKAYLESVKTGFNPAGITDKLKLLEKPLLLLNRKINQSNLPTYIDNAKQILSPLAQRLLTPLAVKSVAPMLYGGVEYNEY